MWTGNMACGETRATDKNQLCASVYKDIKRYAEDSNSEWDEFKYSNVAFELVTQLVDFILYNYRPHHGYEERAGANIIKCYLPYLKRQHTRRLLGQVIGSVHEHLGVTFGTTMRIHEINGVLKYTLNG